MNALKFLGRWKSVRSLEVYIQETMAAMVAIDLAPAVPMVAALAELAPILATPPDSPWEEWFLRRRQYAALLREREALLSDLGKARPRARKWVAQF